MVFRIFDKKSKDSGVNVMPNQLQTANELHKQITRKL